MWLVTTVPLLNLKQPRVGVVKACFLLLQHPLWVQVDVDAVCSQASTWRRICGRFHHLCCVWWLAQVSSIQQERQGTEGLVAGLGKQSVALEAWLASHEWKADAVAAALAKGSSEAGALDINKVIVPAGEVERGGGRAAVDVVVWKGWNPGGLRSKRLQARWEVWGCSFCFGVIVSEGWSQGVYPVKSASDRGRMRDSAGLGQQLGRSSGHKQGHCACR
jgi:hypothetical protein